MEIVGPNGINPVLTGPAARPAKQQEAQRSPTEGFGSIITSPNLGSAIYSPRSPAYVAFSPLFPLIPLIQALLPLIRASLTLLHPQFPLVKASVTLLRRAPDKFKPFKPYLKTIQILADNLG